MTAGRHAAPIEPGEAVTATEPGEAITATEPGEAITATEPGEAVTATEPPRVSPRASLLRVELTRIAGRRFIQLLAGLAVLGFLVTAVVAFTQYSRPTPEIQARAEARRQTDVELSERFRQQCLSDDTIAEGDKEAFCGPVLQPGDLPLEQYIDKRPFTLTGDLPTGSLSVAAATAMLGFVVGATYVGAEWSTRTMVALLFWETRRLKVIAVKTGVAALAGAALALVGQLAWLALAGLLARTRGLATESLPDGFWSGVVGQSGRSVLLGLTATLLGFGLSNLLRNTGAALGVGFAYFAVVETALRVLWPASQPFLVTDSSIALVLDGGLRIMIPGPTVDAGTGSVTEFSELLVPNVRGGLTLAAYLLVLLLAGSWLFRRRDLH